MKTSLLIVTFLFCGVVWGQDVRANFETAQFNSNQFNQKGSKSQETVIFSEYVKFLEEHAAEISDKDDTLDRMSDSYPDLFQLNNSAPVDENSTLMMGDEKGNGGIGIVCRNNNGDVTSAELLDFAEGNDYFFFNYERNEQFYLSQALNIATLIDNKQVSQTYTELFKKYFLSTKNNLNVIMQSRFGKQIKTKWKTTEDFYPRIVPAIRDCSIENIALYRQDGYILLNEEAFRLLPEMHKAGLVTHELLYIMARANGAKNSNEVRKLVALLYSKQNSINSVAKLVNQLLAVKPYNPASFTKEITIVSLYPAEERNSFKRQGQHRYVEKILQNDYSIEAKFLILDNEQLKTMSSITGIQREDFPVTLVYKGSKLVQTAWTDSYTEEDLAGLIGISKAEFKQLREKYFQAEKAKLNKLLGGFSDGI